MVNVKFKLNSIYIFVDYLTVLLFDKNLLELTKIC